MTSNVIRPPTEAPESRVVRHIQRALSELRRGAAVRLTGSGNTLKVRAAEIAGVGAEQGSLLLVAASRAALLAVAPGPPAGPVVAIRLLAGSDLRALSDASILQHHAQAYVCEPAPPLAESALRLAKLGRLLPVMLVDAYERDDIVSADVAEVDAYPAHMATDLVEVASAAVPLAAAADARVVAFRPRDGGAEQVAVLIGRLPFDSGSPSAPLVRLHSECFTGDVLGSLRCDCGPQLREAVARMAVEGEGVVLYLAQEGRGIGLASKLRAYALQDRGLDTLDANLALGWAADERDFAVAAAMLRALGITRARLLTNNPKKVAALRAAGIATERVSHLFAPNGVDDAYLAAKRTRFGHLAE